MSIASLYASCGGRYMLITMIPFTSVQTASLMFHSRLYVALRPCPFLTYVNTRGRSSMLLQLSTGTYALYPGCELKKLLPFRLTHGSWTRIMSILSAQHSCRRAVCGGELFPTFAYAIRMQACRSRLRCLAPGDRRLLFSVTLLIYVLKVSGFVVVDLLRVPSRAP